MRSIISTLVLLIAALFAVPASAIILIATDGDVFTINAGDVFEHVIQLDTSSITMNGGDVTGHFALFDTSTLTYAGGSVGQFEVLNDALVTVVIQPGSLEVDGVPTPEPTTLTTLDCAGCTVSATLANGDPVGPVPLAVLQTGQVEVVAVPEPFTGAMFLLGLLGLGFVRRF